MHHHRLLGLLTLLVVSAPSFAADVKLEASFDDKGLSALTVGEFHDKGLSALKVGEAQILQSGAPRMYVANFRKASDATPLADRAAKAKEILTPGDLKTPPQVAFDAASETWKATYLWGTVAVTYRVAATSLDMKVTIVNTSPDILDQWSLALLDLKLPEEPTWPLISEALYFGQPTIARSVNSLSAPLVIAGGTSQFWFVGCSGETKPLTLSFTPGAEGRKTQCGLLVQAGGDKLLYDEVYDTRPIAPGQSDAFSVSLRFAPPATDPVAAAGDVCKAYAAAHPLLLNWPDRRPIMRSFIGDWFPQRKDPPSMEVPPAVAPADFRERVLKSADAFIATMKKADAQGMIVWNIEGGPASIKYVGDPHMVEILCPEMNAVADEYFKKFRDAGLRVGLCIRPSHIAVTTDANGQPQFVHQYTGPGAVDPVEVLSGKIAYARKRWGCTIFYIDTNSVWRQRTSDGKWSGALMNADQWEEICRRNPGVLLVPEHSYIRYYASSAGYDQMDMGCTVSPPVVKHTWPGAFKCVTIDNPSLRRYDVLVRMWQSGDVILFDGGDAYIRNVHSAKLEADYRAAPPPANAASLARDPDPRNRFFAAAALGAAKTPQAYDTVLTMTADADWLVRKNAVLALGQLGDANATATLLAVMADPNADVEAIGVNAFAAIGASAIVPLAVSLAQPGKTSAGAVAALAAIADPGALSPLIAVLDNQGFPANVRGLALRLVAEKAQRDPNGPACNAVIRQLDDKELRSQAPMWLSRIRGPKAIAALRAALEKEKSADKPDPAQLERLQSTLAAMTKK